MSEYISLKEAAELSGYHQDYLGQLIRSGRLPGKRLGKGWVVQKLTLAEYVAGRNKAPAYKKALALPWWRKNSKVVVTLATLVVLTTVSLAILALEKSGTSVAVGDFTSGAQVETQRVLISDEESGQPQELVVTSYVLDGDNIEVSIQAGNQ